MSFIKKMMFFFFVSQLIACGDGATADKTPVEKEPSAKAAPTETKADPKMTEKEKVAFLNGEVDYQVIAQDFCECAQEAIKAYEETAADLTVPEGGFSPAQKEAYDAASERRSTADEDALKCCIEVKGQRTKQKLDKPKLIESLKTECEALQPSLMIQILIKAIF